MAKEKYDPETFPLLAEGYARDGLTDLQIAEKLGISKNTFYIYVKKYSDFRDALKRGKAPVDQMVENALFKKALSGDITAMIFWLKNRRPDKWRDKKDVEHSGSLQIEVDLVEDE